MTETPSNVENFFADGDEFESALTQAEALPLRGPSADFVADLRDKWETYGCRMYFSQAQYHWLCRIIGAP